VLPGTVQDQGSGGRTIPADALDGRTVSPITGIPYLHTPLVQVLKNVAISRESGIGGIELKFGQPDLSIDIQRVGAVRKLLGDDFPLMVDANQQWDRTKATRACRAFEDFNLTWIEEPLDAYDFEGHAQLAERFDTPIATGEMLTSFGEHAQLILAGTDFLQPDAPRVGGITPFLQIMALGEFKQRTLAPHFAMEIHLHLAAAYGLEPWLEHFEWLGPLFDEQMQLKDGRMWVSDRPGLGFSLSAGIGLDDGKRGIRQAAIAASGAGDEVDQQVSAS
jgi:L-alanine-DL-glutamate epimerase-like enolase superfamily enzyme